MGLYEIGPDIEISIKEKQKNYEKRVMVRRYFLLIIYMVMINIGFLIALDFILGNINDIQILLDIRQRTGLVVLWFIINWFLLQKFKKDLGIRKKWLDTRE